MSGQTKSYSIAPEGATPPETAVWRGILDHRRGTAWNAVWMAAWVAPGLPKHGLGEAHIPEGSILYLEDVRRLPRGRHPRPGECYGHWLARARP